MACCVVWPQRGRQLCLITDRMRGSRRAWPASTCARASWNQPNTSVNASNTRTINLAAPASTGCRLHTPSSFPGCRQRPGVCRSMPFVRRSGPPAGTHNLRTTTDSVYHGRAKNALAVVCIRPLRRRSRCLCSRLPRAPVQGECLTICSASGYRGQTLGAWQASCLDHPFTLGSGVGQYCRLLATIERQDNPLGSEPSWKA